MKPAHVIGVPLDLGGNHRGVDMGPSAIRISGLTDQIGALGVTVVDKGNIATPLAETKGAGDPRKRYIKEIAKVCQQLFQTLQQVVVHHFARQKLALVEAVGVGQ